MIYSHLHVDGDAVENSQMKFDDVLSELLPFHRRSVARSAAKVDFSTPGRVESLFLSRLLRSIANELSIEPRCQRCPAEENMQIVLVQPEPAECGRQMANLVPFRPIWTAKR